MQALLGIVIIAVSIVMFWGYCLVMYHAGKVLVTVKMSKFSYAALLITGIWGLLPFILGIIKAKEEK